MGGHFGGHDVRKLADNVGNICLRGKGKSYKNLRLISRNSIKVTHLHNSFEVHLYQIRRT